KGAIPDSLKLLKTDILLRKKMPLTRLSERHYGYGDQK
ncbi:hypothetical protein C8D97_1151, partial [Pleionea mediterranea]